jgi:hypothetical protein
LQEFFIEQMDVMNQMIKNENENIIANTNKNFEEVKMRSANCMKCSTLEARIKVLETNIEAQRMKLLLAKKFF